MNKNLNQRGDTLIEIIFAFAILATIIGFSFTGVISARKSAVSAQQRTQALEMAQYQSEALQTYRNSLPWINDAGVNCPSFIGGTNGGCSSTPSGLAEIDLSSASANNTYCMTPVGTGSSGTDDMRWKLSGNAKDCDAITPFLSNGPNAVSTITFKPTGRLENDGVAGSTDTQTVQADVKVEWQSSFGTKDSVKNIVILTRQK